MLELGHIDYSNCFPVHARLLDVGAPDWIHIRRGVPSELNEALARGGVDVAPCSSIEYARHAERYRMLPSFAIAARGPVGSILLESSEPLEALTGRVVAVPTASATSVVLLRILLERRYGARPAYRWFDQRIDPEPRAAGAAAALYIGDVALHRDRRAAGQHDLGELWTAWTGLPFVFATWQTALGPERDSELRALHAELGASLAYYEANRAALATRYAHLFGLEPAALEAYWSGLLYRLDAPCLAGLEAFYAHAAAIGELPGAPALRFVAVGDPPAAGLS